MILLLLLTAADPKVTAVNGTAKYTLPKATAPQDAQVGDVLPAKTSVVIGNGRLALDAKVTLLAETEATLNKVLELTRGQALVNDTATVKTPHGTVAIAGNAKITIESARTLVLVFRGEATASKVKASRGSALAVTKQGAPTLLTLPAPPELVSPGEGEHIAVMPTQKVEFAWKRTTDLTRVQIAADPAFTQPLFSGEGDTNSGELELPPGNYYWQITAVAGALESEPQGPRLFVVESKPALAPPPEAATTPRDSLALIVPASTAEQETELHEYDVIGEVRPADAVVTVHGIRVPVDASGRFAATVTLAEGDNEILVQATDGFAKQEAKIKVRAVSKPSPHRVGAALGLLLPHTFRNERFGFALQLSYAYAFTPFVAIKFTAGTGVTTATGVVDPIPATSPFYTVDAGVVFELVRQSNFVPYIELEALGLWIWNNRNFPDAFVNGERTGRTQVAWAPTAGVGLRFRKYGNSLGLGAHYRLLLDHWGTSGHERTRVHGLVEIRMSLSFN